MQVEQGALWRAPFAVTLPMAVPAQQTPRCGAQRSTAAAHGRHPRVGGWACQWGLCWPDHIPTLRTPPEAAPGRPAGIPAGHAVPGMGPGGRRGAQAAAGLDGRAAQDAV